MICDDTKHRFRSTASASEFFFEKDRSAAKFNRKVDILLYLVASSAQASSRTVAYFLEGSISRKSCVKSV